MTYLHIDEYTQTKLRELLWLQGGSRRSINLYIAWRSVTKSVGHIITGQPSGLESSYMTQRNLNLKMCRQGVHSRPTNRLLCHLLSVRKPLDYRATARSRR